MHELSGESGFRYDPATGTLGGMDDEIPIVVRMRVECSKCGHADEDTYEFEMPIDEAQPEEERAPGKCPDCGAPVWIYLSRTQRMQ